MVRLSAFLIAKNEARDLAVCLESLRRLADETVLVDDESTDETVAIAQRFGVRTFTRKLDGFAAQKQFALEQITGDWALSVDADERIPAALSQEIRKIIEQPAGAAGYEIRRRFYFLGRELKFGGLGHDWVLRLFKRGAGHFRPVRVHESIEVAGPIERLNEPMDHFSYATLDEYLEKCHHYTSLAAQDLWSRGRRASWLDHLRPGWELFSRLVVKGAWLDGQRGMMYAALSAHTAWLRAMKLWEIEHHSIEGKAS